MESGFDENEMRQTQRLNYISSFSISYPLETELRYFKKHLRGINYFELRHYPHSHPFFELHFPDGESMNMIIEGENVTVPAEGGILIFPDCIHYWDENNTASRHFSIAFTVKNQSVESYIMELKSDMNYILYGKNEVVSFALSYALRAMDNDYNTRVSLLKSLTSIFMNEIIQDFNSRSKHKVTEISKPSRTALAKKYIAENVRSGLSVSEVSRKLHLSEKQLNRLFVKNEGISVSQYIRNRLCEEAEAQLLRQEQTVKEISYELGFSSASSFSKFFKLHKGLSPTEFRLKCNEN